MIGDMDREKIYEKLVDILKKYGVKKIAVFGSFAGGRHCQRD